MLFRSESRERIEQLEAEMQEHPERRVAQQVLADTVCALVHGAEATAEAKRAAGALFGGSLEGMNKEQLFELFRDAPSTTVTREQVQELDLLSLLATTIAKSKGEARRLVQGGGIYVDNERLSTESTKVSETKLFEKGFIVLRSGKKNYHIVRLEGA